MFEHIYFIKQVFSPPVSSVNYRKVDPFDLEKGDAAGFYDTLEDSYYRYLQNGDFFLNGKAQMVPYYPVSQEVESKLLYIESFAILSTCQHYFTERQNFNSYLLLFTETGSGRLHYGGKTYLLEKGQGFLIDCKNPHKYETRGKEWVHWDLHFNGAAADLLFREFALDDTVLFKPSSESDFKKSIEDLLRTYQTFSSCRDLLVSNHLENLIISLIKNTSHFKKGGERLPEELNNLIYYMNNNYMHPLTLDELADFSGISKYHFIRTFSRYIGCTPQEYLIRLRLHKARELLESTNLPVNKIGCIVGIENATYFYRLFKKRFGITPKAYRKDHLHI